MQNFVFFSCLCKRLPFKFLAHFKIYAHLYTVLFLIAVPAFLSLFKYAYFGLNADILLNQIMALQKPTLFYWGQNRIINIIPFILQFIRLPLLNLFMVLYLATLAFFGSLYMFAWLARKINSSGQDYTNSIYLINLFLCMLIFSQDSWISICLWHFEYSLALLFMMTSLYLFYYGSNRKMIAAFFLAFLSLGLNPFLIVFFAAIILFKCVMTLRITMRDALVFLSACLFFLIWLKISGAYGSFDDYSAILWGNFYVGVQRLLTNLISEYFNLGNLLIVTFSGLCFYALSNRFSWRQKSRQIDLAKNVVIYTLIISCLILALIACIRWTQMNDFSPRYLNICIFCALFANAFWLTSYFAQIRISSRLATFFNVGLCATILIFLYPPTFNLQDCSIYRECNQIAPAGNNFYLGDYWTAWACASRDLNDGHHSHTLVYRASANRKNILQAIELAIDDSSCLDMQCVNSELDFCKKQLDGYFSKYDVMQTENLNAKNIKMRICNLY